MIYRRLKSSQDPLKASKDDGFAVLTDILGDEDHLGDMDFKVAGTARGINALQMDIKIEGITEEIMEIALEQALQARLQFLVMFKTLLLLIINRMVARSALREATRSIQWLIQRTLLMQRTRTLR